MTLRIVAVAIVAAAFFVAAPASASVADESPARATATATSAGDVVPVADGGELGFFDKYFPFSVPDDLEPEVKENVTMTWLLSVLLVPFWSPLWAPILMFGQGAPGDYLVDVIISGLLHYLLHFIPFVNFVAVPLNCLWLCPVAVITIYDRNLKTERGKRVTAQRERDKARRLASTATSVAMAY